MTDVKDKRALFEAKPDDPAASEKRKRPVLPPPKSAKPLGQGSAHTNSSNSSSIAAPSISVSSSSKQGGKTGDRVSKLNPALLKSVQRLEQPGLGGFVAGPGMMGHGGGGAGSKAKSQSPTPPRKKAKSVSKLLPPKAASSAGPGETRSAKPHEMGKRGVGLLASVTKEISASTGNLDSSSISSSSSPKPRPAPPVKPRNLASSITPPPSRKTAALSMDDSTIISAASHRNSETSTRPLSTGTVHRVTTRDTPNGEDLEHSPSLLRRGSPVVSSPLGSPMLQRRRQNSRDSLDKSFSPSDPSKSPSARAVSTHLERALMAQQPMTVSKSTNNFLDSPPSSNDSKPRSSSDGTAPKLKPPPLTKKPKPALPPKKPGLMSRPPPPSKPTMKQVRRSPQFSRNVVSPEREVRTHAKSASPDLMSPTSEKPPPPPPAPRSSASLDKQREGLSPPLTSSPTTTTTTTTAAASSGAPLRGEVPEVISPLPSTPSPRSSQLEAVRRNADSGFASETAEDLASPVETQAENNVIKRRGGEGGEEGDAGREKEGEGQGEEKEGEKTEEEKAEPPVEVWDEARLEKARNKRLHIAEELLKTEATYVERLELIAVKFYGAVMDFSTQHKHVIPDADINRIFLNISQIYNLNQNILEELQKRMATWNTQEGLGDVIARLAPFLKLYAHYTAGFEDAMKMLTAWTKREKKFDALVREFESQLSTGLGVAHYMLEPVQRIPRYRMLLTDYLKYTPPDSPDRQPTQKAVSIISEAADHSNDRIKELENSNIILSIQRSLQDFEGTLLAPGRLFLRKGHLQKFSRKTTTPRMFFLFSDILLHTEPTGADVFKFKNEMPIFMMKVEEPVVSLVPHSFNVESTTRSLILVASSESEKREWMGALRAAISEERKKRSSLRRDISNKITTGLFGAQAPIMVPDKSVTMCQACSAVFSFTFRRHHCRGCGKVVCGSCSQWKAYLPYLKKYERVCERCNYVSKSESGEDVDGPPPSPKMSKKDGGGILDLKAYEEDTIKAGYVLSQDGRKWCRLWYQVKQDFCLYKFRAHEDIKAISSHPLPGYIVKSDRSTFTITLNHPSSKKEFSDTFRLENPEDFDIWVLALESVIRLEVPSLPRLTDESSPPPDERFRSQSLRDLNALVGQGESPLENSI